MMSYPKTYDVTLTIRPAVNANQSSGVAARVRLGSGSSRGKFATDQSGVSRYESRFNSLFSVSVGREKAMSGLQSKREV